MFNRLVMSATPFLPLRTFNRRRESRELEQAFPGRLTSRTECLRTKTSQSGSSKPPASQPGVIDDFFSSFFRLGAGDRFLLPVRLYHVSRDCPCLSAGSCAIRHRY